jgi:tetratricopeptide (TPR) repeat protein
LGHVGQSIELLKDALDMPPEPTLNYVISSKIFLDIFRESQQSPQALLGGLQEGYRQGYLVLSELLLRQKNFPDLMKYAMKAVELNFDKKGEFFFYAGRAAFVSGDYRAATLLLKNSVDRNSANALAMQYLGTSLQKLGEDTAGQILLHQAGVLKDSGSVEDPLPRHIRIF